MMAGAAQVCVAHLHNLMEVNEHIQIWVAPLLDTEAARRLSPGAIMISCEKEAM
jgi:hypothetical protein